MSGTSLPPVYTFIAWIAFLAAIIAAVVIYRWRRPHRYSRFQLKLTLALILFLLIPTVPLLFVAGITVDQLRGLVVTLPLDDALDKGLSMVRQVLHQEEERLLAWQERIVGEAGSAQTLHSPPDFTALFEKDENGVWEMTAFEPESTEWEIDPDSLIAEPPDPRIERRDALEDAAFTENERVLFHYRDDIGVYMALVKPPGSETINGAGIWINSETVVARYSLELGLRSFRNIVSLGGTGFREILWIIASFWMVVLTVGAFFASRVLAQGVSEPVVELARGMEAVASGDLDTRLDIVAQDEMQILIDSFNTMTDQIREARERIVMAEKQSAWQDVARRIAHEIKNPLTPIQIGLHRIRTRLEGDEKWAADPAIRESFQTMNEEVEALRRMAASFSEFAQLPQPEKQEGDLETVVRGAVALFQQHSQRVRFNLDIRGQIPPISMDLDLVKRALINLIKNAVESVEQAGGGGVDIFMERRGSEILLKIHDNGVGFDPELASRLFSPDFTTKSRGTGLGLSIVARIFANHSWRLEAESEGPDTGATISIQIPLGEAVI